MQLREDYNKIFGLYKINCWLKKANMKFNKTFSIYLIFSCSLFLQCKFNSSDYNAKESNDYTDGTYCAEIDYYYSETGTNSTYILEVGIENNKLSIIYWPNGGWLDSSHFLPPDISAGEASFTCDRGVAYSVKIIGDGGGCTSNSFTSDKMIDVAD